MRYISYFFIFILFFTVISCVPFSREISEKQGELIIYLQTVGRPVSVKFVLETIQIEDKSGLTFNFTPTLKKIDALSLLNKQILLAKIQLPAGFYQKISFKVKEAYSKYKLLSLPKNELFTFLVSTNIRPKQTTSLFLTWYPENSIKDDTFTLAMEIGQGRTGLKQLLLYVSNSGDNYISVIDRGTHQVIDNITVGKSPKGMVLSEDKSRLYVVNSISQNISVIEVMSNRVMDTISCPMGVELNELVLVSVMGREYLYVTATSSNAVLVIDAQAKHFVKKIDVGQRPIGIAADPNGKYVYVANSYSNDIYVIDTYDNTVVHTIGVGGKPRYLIVTDRYILVSNAQTNTVTVLKRLFLEEVRTIFVPNSPGRIIEGLQSWFYVTGEKSNDISFINPLSNVVFKRIPVGIHPCGLALDRDRKLLYVTNLKENTVSVIDLIKEKEIERISVGNAPYALILTGE